MKASFCFFLLLVTTSTFSQNRKAKELVNKMTLDEKLNLVVGMGMKLGAGNTNNVVLVGQTMDKVPGAAGITYGLPRLGIPNTVVADGPAGLRIEPIRNNDSSKTYYATAWPVATLLASTWDIRLVEQVGKAMGNEVKEYGVDVLLAPGLNIHRNPLGGRNFEYYSEDPLISGKMAAAMVNGIQSNGIGTSIKHFAANNQEKNRNSVNVIVSERALREIYLKGFEIAVKESHPWTVMSSYNYINGKYTSEDYDLLTTILRKEWGFEGIVMTDWFGGSDAVAQMKAGNDLLMPGTTGQKKAISDAIANGSLDIKVLDENAARIVNYILNTQAYHKYAFSNKPDLKSHAAIARTAAADGMVLLKNESNTLPLRKNGSSIAVFGITSYDFVSGGTGSGDVNEEYTISLVQGLSNAGLTADKELTNIYLPYVAAEKAKQPKKSFLEEFVNPTPRIPELAIENDLLKKKAAETDIALITIGRNAGEGSDRKTDNNFNLSEAERTMIKNVTDAFHAQHKKVVVIINSGGVIETASWRDQVDAILLAWQPGLEAGNAVADILSGKVNPSGKLATTFPLKYEDDPSAKNFPGTEFPEKAKTGNIGMRLIPAEVVYEEDIYVGYRYYKTFDVPAAYPFGYGLSYTNFKYSDLKISSKSFSGKITITATITNMGNKAGKEVVQLYISAPGKSMNKPAIELKGFTKTKLLNPNESQVVRFEITTKDLVSFDSNTSSWIAEKGEYKIMIGASSTNLPLSSSFSAENEMITEKTNKVMTPAVTINMLRK